MNSIHGKTLVISGGAAKIVSAISRSFGVDGANVVACYYSADTPLDVEETIASVSGGGGQIVVFQARLTHRNLLTHAAPIFDMASEVFGGVDFAAAVTGQASPLRVLRTMNGIRGEAGTLDQQAAHFFLEEARRRLSDCGKVINLGLTSSTPAEFNLFQKGGEVKECSFRTAVKEQKRGEVALPLRLPGGSGEAEIRTPGNLRSAPQGVDAIVSLFRFIAASDRNITGADFSVSLPLSV
ncbi:hypothetical protein [Streptomyces sp. NPDC059003]|uniref:hypothetical protein n=1 Tax=Streptomyces sp. NPDC059003 TaxID=3346691 RepID=UPI003695D07B